MCGKLAFTSRAHAKEHARGISKAPRTQEGRGGARMTRPYRCDGCGLWHLTSQTKREQRQKGRRR
jgi:hypothetical protein